MIFAYGGGGPPTGGAGGGAPSNPSDPFLSFAFGSDWYAEVVPIEWTAEFIKEQQPPRGSECGSPMDCLMSMVMGATPSRDYITVFADNEVVECGHGRCRIGLLPDQTKEIVVMVLRQDADGVKLLNSLIYEVTRKGNAITTKPLDDYASGSPYALEATEPTHDKRSISFMVRMSTERGDTSQEVTKFVKAEGSGRLGVEGTGVGIEKGVSGSETERARQVQREITSRLIEVYKHKLPEVGIPLTDLQGRLIKRLSVTCHAEGNVQVCIPAP